MSTTRAFELNRPWQDQKYTYSAGPNSEEDWDKFL